MKVSTYPDKEHANQAAAELLANWLLLPQNRNVMPAAGNTPLDVYERIAQKKLSLSHLVIFTLDEYVGVPLDEPRNCTNLLRRAVAKSWSIPDQNFFWISSKESDALASVQQHEKQIEKAGGLDIVVLGLGQNGHLGFNEPGSAENSTARIVDLQKISIEANRQWFEGRYAPAKGATIGLKAILSARKILLLAYGPHKAEAVKAMIEGKRDSAWPASFLQGRPNVHAFLDAQAASKLAHK